MIFESFIGTHDPKRNALIGQVVECISREGIVPIQFPAAGIGRALRNSVSARTKEIFIVVRIGPRILDPRFVLAGKPIGSHRLIDLQME